MSDPKTIGYTGDSPEATPKRHNVRDTLSRLVIFKQLENPRDHHFWEKAAITFVVAVAGAAAPIGSSIVLREYNADLSPKSSLTMEKSGP